MKTNCIIVDDEPIAIEIIEDFLIDFQTIEIVAKCKNAVEAFEIVNNQKIDLIFLDIKMPKWTGLEFAKSMTNPPKIIITTAYREFALEGFELNVIDYLLKPISFDRFVKALDKYFETVKKITPANNQISSNTLNYIYLKDNKSYHKVFLHDILFIESYRDHIMVHTEQSKIKTYVKISDIEKNLSSDLFVRTHKSFIVSINKIKSFNTKIVVLGETNIPIGITYKNNVLKKLGLNAL